jgi:hypothetical protein
MAQKLCRKWLDKQKEISEKLLKKLKRIALPSYLSTKSILSLPTEKKYTERSKEELSPNYLLSWTALKAEGM